MAFASVSWAYRDVITSAKLAQMVENDRTHDHRLDGTQGTALGVARTATLVGNWTSANTAVRWSQIGKLVCVQVYIARSGAAKTFAAWEGEQVASGLPPSTGGNTLNFTATNQVEYGGFAFYVDGAGALFIQSRWSGRTFGQGGWAQGCFTYIAA